MFCHKITFGSYENDQLDELLDQVDNYLATLSRNGQIDTYYYFIPWQGQIVAYVLAHGLDADRLKYHSIWGKEELKKIKKAFNQKPLWELHEDHVIKSYKPTWQNTPFLYFTTGFMDWESPLVRGDNGAPIPLYRVSITDLDRDAIRSWLWRYRSFDEVWIGSCDLERQAYSVLTDPNSELSQWGRDCCRAIEKATSVPTYYWLMRYYGRQEEEEKQRRCPGCGKSWFIKKPVGSQDESKPFWHFDFMCKKCRLVSHLAVGETNLRYARIGEFREKKSK